MTTAKMKDAKELAKALKKRTRARKKADKPHVHKTAHPTPRETRLALKKEDKERKEAIRLKQLANHM